MTWFWLALSSAILVSISTVLEKKILIKEHALEFAATLALTVGALSLPLLYFVDYSRLRLEPVLILFGTALFGALAYWLVAKSMRHLEVSSVSPLLILSPALTAVLASWLLKETLTGLQIISIGLLLGGAYLLELGKNENLLSPFREFHRSRFLHYILLAVLIYGLGALVDRWLLSRYDFQPVAYLALINLFIAFHFLVLAKLFNRGERDLKHGFKNTGLIVFLIAGLVVAHRYAEINAVKIVYVGLAVAVKRSSVLFSVILGGTLFHEHNLFRKIAAALIMTGGAVLLAI